MIARELCGRHVGKDIVTERGAEPIVMITHKKNGVVLVRVRYGQRGSTRDVRFRPDAQVYVGR